MMQQWSAAQRRAEQRSVHSTTDYGRHPPAAPRQRAAQRSDDVAQQAMAAQPRSQHVDGSTRLRTPAIAAAASPATP